ncbi:DotU family type IV/VI secretion system protein [Pantoea agglomerans]|uniref:DotU family type IV/VI secretion system protein n=1 Tax=Enterobacter agglomerans TaxID=549 RepID=UPI002413445F|nr:DotU family type IV/VI secretion system protein [Pantoea agglomerans]
MSSLLNCYIPVFRMGVKFSIASEDFPHCDDFRKECITLLDKALLQSELLYRPEDSSEAHFAVVVWLDELVLRTSPTWVKEWRLSLLQSQRFRTAIGGEEFYARLDGIDTSNKDLRQVYLFCLLMGFQGKYAHKGNAELQARISEERKCLPEEWQTWPGEARIMAKDVESKPAQAFQWLRILHKKASLFFFVTLMYLMTVSGLHLLIRN